MTDDSRDPKLQALDALVGDWALGDPSAPLGRTSFSWLQGGYFLVQRWTVDIPVAPDGIAILGEDATTGGLVQHYYDSRGVARVYRMRLEDGTWTLWRDGPDFWQRFRADSARTGRPSPAPGSSRPTARAGSTILTSATRRCDGSGPTPSGHGLVARRRHLPGLPRAASPTATATASATSPAAVPAALPGRPRRRRDLDQPLVPVADGRRRLRRVRLPRRRARVRHPRRGRGADRRGARAGLRVIARPRAQPHLRPAPLVPAALAAGPGSPERDRYLFRDGRGPDGAQPPNDWAQRLRRPGLDPGDRAGRPTRRVVPAPVRPRAARPELGPSRGPRRLRRRPAVLVRPRRRRVPDRRRPRPGQGPGPARLAGTRAPARLDARPAGTPEPPALGPRRGARHLPAVAARSPTTTTRPRVFVAEAWVDEPDRLARYVRPDELHTAFNFDYLTAPWEARGAAPGRSTRPSPSTPRSAPRPPGCCPTTT